MRPRHRRALTALVLAVGVIAAPQLPIARSQPAGAPGAVSTDPSHWSALGGAALSGDADSLLVRAPGTSAPGASTGAITAAPGRQVVTLTLRSVSTAGERTVRLAVQDDAGHTAQSAPITLQPWWQTATVTLANASRSLRLGVVSTGTWHADDAFAVRDVRAATVASTTSRRAGRLLLVNGQPYTMKGVVYFTAPIGGTPWTTPWHSEPAQCQADAQLMRAAGINTIRAYFVPELWDATTGNQCLDAFYGAGVRVIWLIQPPGGTQWQVEQPVYVDAYWASLARGIAEVKDHPATLAYNIGNEIKFLDKNSAGWFGQVNELARRAKTVDPTHVMTTTISANQFLDGYYGGPVSPTLSPEIDMWGVNLFAEKATGYRKFMPALKSFDNTRPIWISEFGADRYTCLQPGPSGLTCTKGNEDARTQADWDASNWRELAANLTTVDPKAGLVGATVVMWSDLWWFAMGFNGQGTLHTREVAGTVSGWSRSSFPDGHLSWEYFGINQAQPQGATGPRLTTQTYDTLGTLFTGHPHLGFAGPKVSVSGCDVKVDFVTSDPAFGRVDWGPVARVEVAGNLVSDSFYALSTLQGSVPATAHHFDLGRLTPGTTFEIHPRGFDASGRPVSADGARVTTPAAC
jgi:hypothetical protein